VGVRFWDNALQFWFVLLVLFYDVLQRAKPAEIHPAESFRVNPSAKATVSLTFGNDQWSYSTNIVIANSAGFL